MKNSVYDYDGKIFDGCLRNLRLSTESENGKVRFPEGITGLLYGICHTSAVW